MADSTARRLSAGLLWPLVLLALPNCVFDSSGDPLIRRFDPGASPTSAIMCDIPVPRGPDVSLCATKEEANEGVPLMAAATALATGRRNSIGLDYSEAARKACDGMPAKTVFHGLFPDGLAVCLNCAQIPVVHADRKAVCVAKCTDLINFGGTAIPTEGAEAFCAAWAHVSTNFDENTCFDNVCSNNGTPSNFADPRRVPEPVTWIALEGTSAAGNTLTRVKDDTDLFDAGGASDQIITRGDAWVEFEAGEDNEGHIIGFSPATGIYADPSEHNIAFALRLKTSGEVAVHENGVEVSGPHGTYDAGDRFRVRITDDNSFFHTATISYTRVIGPCPVGTACNEQVIATSAGLSKPTYPFRVDATLGGGKGVRLVNVTLVRIK